MRIREKRTCFNCDKTFSALFRCKIDEKGHWVLICNICIDLLKIDNIFYQYGGTWKAKKRN